MSIQIHKKIHIQAQNEASEPVEAQHREEISRSILVDEGHREVVEVEQSAIRKFLWCSGTISGHMFVDQNREDHTVKFKKGKSGLTEKFEGCRKVEPLFVDEQYGSPLKLRSWAGYDSCTGDKGRIGSIVGLEQLIQPALVPPPPISCYLRAITARITEMLITDLLAEAARLRGTVNNGDLSTKVLESNFDPTGVDHSPYSFDDNTKD